MAAPSFTLTTNPDWSVSVGTAGGNREDLIDIITNIQRDQTPLLSNMGQTQARATLHEWPVDILEQPTVGSGGGVQSTAEGSDATFAATQDPVRLRNNTHIMRKTLEVTDTQDVVDKAGRQSEVAYRSLKRMKELLRQTERNLIYSTFQAQTQTGNALTSPADETRQMEGIRPYLQVDPTGQTLAADFEGTTQGTTFSPREFLTEARLNDFLQSIYDKHGRPNTIWVNMTQKRIISTFSGLSTRNIDSDERRLIAIVNVYESDGGILAIHLHDLIDQEDLFALQFEMFWIAWLRMTKVEQLARIGDATKIMVEHELTLEVRAPNSSGFMFDLSSTFADASAEGTAPTYAG